MKRKCRTMNRVSSDSAARLKNCLASWPISLPQTVFGLQASLSAASVDDRHSALCCKATGKDLACRPGSGQLVETIHPPAGDLTHQLQLDLMCPLGHDVVHRQMRPNPVNELKKAEMH